MGSFMSVNGEMVFKIGMLKYQIFITLLLWPKKRVNNITAVSIYCTSHI